MKRAFSAAVAGAGIGLALLASAAEGVVARVNGVPITAEAVSGMMARMGAGTGQGHGIGEKAPKDERTLRKEALDRLIFEELAWQKAKADRIIAGPGEVDRRLEDMRARLGGAEEMKKALEKEGRTEERLRAGIERDIVLRRIFGREVSDKVSVPEEAVAREYEREKGKYVKPEKVVVDDIVFFLKTGERASVERAEEIRRKVLEDKDRNPWSLAPDGTFIVHEVEIRPEKERELYREAVTLKAGEISRIIETSDSLHFIKLKEYSPMKQLTLDQVRVFIERKLVAEASQERLRRWEAELRKGAEVEIMEGAYGKP